MPIVDVTIFKGRTPEAKKNMMKAVTEAIVETLGAPRQDVRVIIREIERENFTVGGEPKPTRAAVEAGPGSGQA